MKSLHAVSVFILLALIAGTANASRWNVPEGAGTAGPRFNMPDGSISQQDAMAMVACSRASRSVCSGQTSVSSHAV